MTRPMTGCAVATALFAGLGCVDELEIETARGEIRDGTEVAEGDWEAVVKVLVNGQVCTGTLFDDTHVLAAAHCICETAERCTNPAEGHVIFTNVLHVDGRRGTDPRRWTSGLELPGARSMAISHPVVASSTNLRGDMGLRRHSASASVILDGTRGGRPRPP